MRQIHKEERWNSIEVTKAREGEKESRELGEQSNI